MPRVLQCIEWNDAAQTCTTEAWVEQPASLVSMLPTVEQANAVGIVMFTSLVTLAAIKSMIVKPPSREE